MIPSSLCLLSVCRYDNAKRRAVSIIMILGGIIFFGKTGAIKNIVIDLHFVILTRYRPTFMLGWK
jgi:hypothetical protein